eukprot:4560646-Pyramimonas_sp.AAC.1
MGGGAREGVLGGGSPVERLQKLHLTRQPRAGSPAERARLRRSLRFVTLPGSLRHSFYHVLTCQGARWRSCVASGGTM